MRIGIDLGGTKTEGVVIDRQGEIQHRLRRPTPVAEGYQAILANIVSLVAELEGLAGNPCRVGIGTPGALTRKGLLKNSNTTCLNGQLLKTDLEDALGRPVRLANDANCFALSEAIDGAGQGHRTVFGVIMGTGVGGGIVFDGQLHEGPQHIAGEWGHNVLDPDGPACYCGRTGCVETLLSGSGLVYFHRQHGGDGLTARQIAASQDPIARAALADYLEAFGRAMSVVVNILDPDVVVLGGGMSNIPELYTLGRERLAAHVFNDELLTPVVQNLHGDSGGVRGAAWLWPATSDGET